MINWIVTINRPMYRQVSDVLVPKDKVTEKWKEMKANNLLVQKEEQKPETTEDNSSVDE